MKVLCDSCKFRRVWFDEKDSLFKVQCLNKNMITVFKYPMYSCLHYSKLEKNNIQLSLDFIED